MAEIRRVISTGNSIGATFSKQYRNKKNLKVGDFIRISVTKVEPKYIEVKESSEQKVLGEK